MSESQFVSLLGSPLANAVTLLCPAGVWNNRNNNEMHLQMKFNKQMIFCWLAELYEDIYQAEA